ncbi:DNA-binding transcriptional MocR family regulator [Rhodoferax ferrireducens]|uniref:DNA-binding transcriptional MocR family regulator n=1 Tax=Rhodoferax ferrireducens TaxID=192843 RepID=A0ABU2C212_9BURK|nr:PLP-dependent aminotransferase family protein [Rhodoferax ferrireducens]MDR7375376.1 DNA-binding transcriptional MocR family regulator [Rhodoferax ferrireducens]
MTMPAAHPSPPKYQSLAEHYRSAIQAGSLLPGQRMPSLRELVRQHAVSLSTAMHVCRLLESEGTLEARPRSGYFVRTPERSRLAPVNDPPMQRAPDPAQYVGIHTKVSEFLALGRMQRFKTNLSTARCAPELYPSQALNLAAQRSLRQDPEQLVRAAPPQGCLEFREVLAQRAMGAGMHLSANDIQVTNGCTEALNLVLRAVAQPGDTIAVESPTFYGLLQTLESLGLKALEIPTSPRTGISVDAVELALRNTQRIKAVVVIPYLQNPTGSIMPSSHKQALLRLCQQHDVALIEDDTYSALVDDSVLREEPLRAIKSWDDSGHVVYCASLHKSLAPGLRLGWVSAGRWQTRVEMLKFAASRSNERLAQRAAASFIASAAYDRYLRRLRSILATQRTQTAQAVASYFPPGTRLTVPRGGLSLWVELPHQLSATALFHAALAENMVIAPGTIFTNSNRFENHLRVNCGWPFTPEIDHAFARLGQMVGALAHATSGAKAGRLAAS